MIQDMVEADPVAMPKAKQDARLGFKSEIFKSKYYEKWFTNEPHVI